MQMLRVTRAFDAEYGYLRGVTPGAWTDSSGQNSVQCRRPPEGEALRTDNIAATRIPGDMSRCRWSCRLRARLTDAPLDQA